MGGDWAESGGDPGRKSEEKACQGEGVGNPRKSREKGQRNPVLNLF